MQTVIARCLHERFLEFNCDCLRPTGIRSDSSQEIYARTKADVWLWSLPAPVREGGGASLTFAIPEAFPESIGLKFFPYIEGYRKKAE
jgi:hypothetical protein